jgi:hypothetical protein
MFFLQNQTFPDVCYETATIGKTTFIEDQVTTFEAEGQFFGHVSEIGVA